MTPEELEAIMADIASANTRYGKRVDRIRERIRKMRSVIIQQKAQIATLKEKLVESQAAINSLSLPLGMDPIDLGIDWSEGELEAARQQLKAEMPGVKWE